MKLVRLCLFTAVGLVVAILAFQFVFVNNAYRNIECGTQKWEVRVLWWDFGQPSIDEYGIASRWACAHKKACADNWEKGALGASSSEYWPELHLMIAKGTEIDKIAERISNIDTADLAAEDRYGRSIYHWLAVHPDQIGARALTRELTENDLVGLLEDHDNLTPCDWANSCYTQHSMDHAQPICSK